MIIVSLMINFVYEVTSYYYVLTDENTLNAEDVASDTHQTLQ